MAFDLVLFPFSRAVFVSAADHTVQLPSRLTVLSAYSSCVQTHSRCLSVFKPLFLSPRNLFVSAWLLRGIVIYLATRDTSLLACSRWT